MDDNGQRRPARYGSLPMNERESRYSQPKLELYGLFRALRHYRLYIIGVKNLQVEVDARYIKGMLNEPDLQPNATMNRWIQGILLFDFKLIHIPAQNFKGPDALSQRTPTESDESEREEDDWLDDIALAINEHTMSSVLVGVSRSQEGVMHQIYEFLTTLKLPTFPTTNVRTRFIRRALKFFVNLHNGKMYKRNGHEPPLLVVLQKAD